MVAERWVEQQQAGQQRAAGGATAARRPGCRCCPAVAAARPPGSLRPAAGKAPPQRGTPGAGALHCRRRRRRRRASGIGGAVRCCCCGGVGTIGAALVLQAPSAPCVLGSLPGACSGSRASRNEGGRLSRRQMLIGFGAARALAACAACPSAFVHLPCCPHATPLKLTVQPPLAVGSPTPSPDDVARGLRALRRLPRLSALPCLPFTCLPALDL